MTDSPALDETLDQFIRAMPKAEIHVHLEGTVRPRTLFELAACHGVNLPARDEAELARFYQFRDFPHFVDVYITVCSCLCHPDDFARITLELGEDAARQNTRYLEVFFNPEPHVRKRGIAFDALLDGMNRGRAEACDRWGVEIRWIADGVRDAESGPISVRRTVDWITGLTPEQGVVGLGLGGDEVGHPPAPFAADFTAARASGLHVVAHAGETTGPETIWQTLLTLGAERIGHGISAISDPVLVEHLASHQIPLEICPSSNLRTGVVPSPADHPFARLDKAGVLVTVNSDDPPMFGTTLTDEYRFLARHFGYTAPDLARISLNALHASFLPQPEKARLMEEFRAEIAELSATLSIST